MSHESVDVTLKHIRRVGTLIKDFSFKMLDRAINHDASKFTPEEREPLDAMQRMINEEGQAPYGTPEYNRRTALLRDMLLFHYARNSHHPEHYEGGVAGMTLYDVVEMWCDWKAASERGEESAINVSHLVKKYGIDPMLEQIFINTAAADGWAIK